MPRPITIGMGLIFGSTYLILPTQTRVMASITKLSTRSYCRPNTEHGSGRHKRSSPNEAIGIGINGYRITCLLGSLTELNLQDWYGPLEPGLYRLVNKYRVDVESPWTNDSRELLFEVVPQQ